MDFFNKKQSDVSRASKHGDDAPGTSGKSASKKVVPWVEKYRPRTVEEVAYQDEVVSVLQKTITSQEFPNFLFYGPPGTGKTSTILAIAKQLFSDIYKTRVLELNASDERGIQVIREKVKAFSMQSVSATRTDGSSCPSFKIVILDEADSMTSAAQASLRRTMEKQSKNTRFCLICNYVTRIIEPLTSRCSKFRFKPLSVETIQARLQEICQKEDINITEEAMENLINLSEGDMRKAITYLQSVSRLKAEAEINADDIMEITGAIPSKIIHSLMTACQSSSYDKLEKAVQNIISNGYSGTQFLNQIHDEIIVMVDIDDNKKSVILEKLAVCDKCLCDGADEYLQLMALTTVIMDQMCTKA